MEIASLRNVVTVTAAGFLFLFAQQAPAQTAPVRVIASNGVKGVLDEVRPQSEKAIGHPLSIEFGTTATLKKEIDAGAPFDVVILTSEAIDALAKDGKIAASTRHEVSRVGIGVGIRAGAAKPDIGTAEALKRSLLSAKSITYAKEGASRPTIDKMLERMGIVDAVKSKSLLLDGADQTSAAVAAGKTEILLTLISEIRSAPGVDFAGPLPAEFQNYVNFAAGISVHAKDAEASEALIKFLTGAKVAPAFKAKGMEPR
jgi:molybdate transport system substrate-binding protein